MKIYFCVCIHYITSQHTPDRRCLSRLVKTNYQYGHFPVLNMCKTYNSLNQVLSLHSHFKAHHSDTFYVQKVDVEECAYSDLIGSCNLDSQP